MTLLNSRSLLLALGITALAPPVAQAQETGGVDATASALPELVISATRNRATVNQTPQRTKIISREEIEQQLAISDDPGQVLSNLIPSYSPGRQKLTNAGETLRGRAPLFMVDGVPQTNPLRDSARDSYTIDMDMVERIEVIYGASAEHGLGATGGIINFVTREPESGSLKQSVTAKVTTDDDVSSDGQGYKLGYRLSGQSGQWDYLAGATFQERGVYYDGKDEPIGIAYPGEIQNSQSYDLLAKVGYWIDDNQNVEFFVNRFDLEGNDDYRPATATTAFPRRRRKEIFRASRAITKSPRHDCPTVTPTGWATTWTRSSTARPSGPSSPPHHTSLTRTAAAAPSMIRPGTNPTSWERSSP